MSSDRQVEMVFADGDSETFTGVVGFPWEYREFWCINVNGETLYFPQKNLNYWREIDHSLNRTAVR